jgi:hypothetical protein
MKPKATTMQQRMGFADADLTSPKHDALIFWLVEHRYQVAVNCGCPLSPKLKKYRSSSSFYKDADAIANAEGQIAFDIYDNDPRAETAILLERPIMDKTFVIGFIDAIITAYRPCLYGYEDKGRIQWEWKLEASSRLFIEAKPTIPSFGELLR